MPIVGIYGRYAIPWILVAPAGILKLLSLFFCSKVLSVPSVWKVLFILSWLSLCSSIFDGCIFYKGPKPFSQHMNSKSSSPSWFFIGQFIEFTFPKMYPKLIHVFFLTYYFVQLGGEGGRKNIIIWSYD